MMRARTNTAPGPVANRRTYPVPEPGRINQQVSQLLDQNFRAGHTHATGLGRGGVWPYGR